MKHLHDMLDGSALDVFGPLASGIVEHHPSPKKIFADYIQI
jgi:hypothetical protein